MPKEIWNEGRVLGLSAYEEYVKQHIATDPDTPPLSEREWLARSISCGSSLLLQLGTTPEQAHNMIQVTLPAGCTLYAASTIVASFFDGDAAFDIEANCQGAESAYFASRVTNYGRTISNTASSNPTATGTSEITTSNVPSYGLSDYAAVEIARLEDFIKIVDGLVIHPGTWSVGVNRPPRKDFKPNYGSTDGAEPVLRFYLNGSITSGTRILLTGFYSKSKVTEMSEGLGSTHTENPQNGDFLGPTCFPWATKIIFSVPNLYMHYIKSGFEHTYTRTLNSQQVTVSDAAIVDMEATNPGIFYDNYSQVKSMYGGYTSRDPGVSFTVNENDPIKVANDVLTVYQSNSKYPPALYATKVTNTGTNRLNPLDIVAPGTVKVFNDTDSSTVDTTLANYEKAFPGTHAFNISSDGILQYRANSTLKSLLNSTSVSYTSMIATGTSLGILSVGDVDYDIIAPASGGANASYLPILTEGTKIGVFESGGISTDVFAPSIKQIITSDHVSLYSIIAEHTVELSNIDTTNYYGIVVGDWIKRGSPLDDQARDHVTEVLVFSCFNGVLSRQSTNIDALTIYKQDSGDTLSISWDPHDAIGTKSAVCLIFKA